MALTHADIWAAADRLEEVPGISATLASVRRELGNKGSFTTISEAMVKRPKRNLEIVQEVGEALPVPVAENLTALGRKVWACAQACANERLQADRLGFDRVRVQVEKERDQALELATQAAAEIDLAQPRIEALEASVVTLQREMDGLRLSLAQGRERLAASVAHGAECERRVDDLNRELERINESNSTLIRSLADHSQNRPAMPVESSA